MTDVADQVTDLGSELNMSARLAREVRRRRSELGLSQAALARRGALSLATLGAIERGKARTFTAPTLAALDRALDWEVGHAQGILDDERDDERNRLAHGLEGSPQEAMLAMLADVQGALADLRREPSWLAELGRIAEGFDEDEQQLVLFVARWVARRGR